MVDHVSGVATPVQHLFQQLENIFHENDLNPAVAARVEQAQKVQNELVPFSLNHLTPPSPWNRVTRML